MTSEEDSLNESSYQHSTDNKDEVTSVCIVTDESGEMDETSEETVVGDHKIELDARADGEKNIIGDCLIDIDLDRENVPDGADNKIPQSYELSDKCNVTNVGNHDGQIKRFVFSINNRKYSTERNRSRPFRFLNGLSRNHLQHRCEFCQEGFISEQELEYHCFVYHRYKYDECFEFEEGDDEDQEIIHSDGCFGCEMCHQDSEESIFEDHYETHVVERPHECDICGNHYSDRTGLRRHKLIHSGVYPFGCDFCDKKFLRLPLLKRHLFVHSEERVHKCDYCDKTFKMKIYLKRHLMTHRNEKPYSCDICGKKFTRKDNLTVHKRIHARNQSQPMEELPSKLYVEKIKREDDKDLSDNDTDSASFSNSSHEILKTALLFGVNSENLYSSHCVTGSGENTNRLPEFEKFGQNVDSEMKPYSCDVCGEGFTLLGSLEYHQSNKHRKLFNCNTCQQKFPNFMSLERHLLTHERKGEREQAMHVCSTCGKMFNSERDLQRHMSYHREDRPHGCNLCTKAFMTKGDLKRHMLSHSDIKPHSCDRCGKSFRRKDNLTVHRRKCIVRTVLAVVKSEDKSSDGSVLPETSEMGYDEKGQANELPFKCHLCEKRYTSEPGLKRHLLTHSGEKPHECEFCDKTFVVKGDLNRHMLSHTNERLYVCDGCGKGCNRKDNLTVHMQSCKLVTRDDDDDDASDLTNHAIDEEMYELEDYEMLHMKGSKKVYNCSLCNKRYFNSSGLKRHMMTHTGEKPFACDYCQKAFITKGDMKRHTLTHSKDKHHSCDICGKSFTQASSLKDHRTIHIDGKFNDDESLLFKNDVHRQVDKPSYDCQLCDKKFLSTRLLKRHVLLHNEESSHVCYHCDKSFKTKRYLNKHLLTHSNKKPFVCNICGKGCSRKDNLTVHMRIHSRDTE